MTRTFAVWPRKKDLYAVSITPLRQNMCVSKDGTLGGAFWDVKDRFVNLGCQSVLMQYMN